MSNINDYLGGIVRKFELLTSGTTWTLPTNLAGDTVWISAIAGGEAYNSTGPVYGQGGSYIQCYPYTASGNVTYSIGAGGAGTAGANGTDTVWDAITLQGGGEADCSGALGRNSSTGALPEVPPGPFGSGAAAGNTVSKGGGGLMLNGTLYGNGGTSGAGGAGAILVEWWEFL